MDTQEMETEFTDLSDIVAADGEKDVVAVYELGYHLVPTLTEGDVDAAAARITDAVKNISEEIVGERAPVKMQLAYTIEKKIDGAKRSFGEAHFGWIAFSAPGSTLKELDEKVATDSQVVRHLIVATSRDAVAATLADPALDVPASQPAVEEEVAAEEPEDGTVESVGGDDEGGDE